MKEFQDNYEKAKLYEALASMELLTNKAAEGICESPIKKSKKTIEDEAALKI